LFSFIVRDKHDETFFLFEYDSTIAALFFTHTYKKSCGKKETERIYTCFLRIFLIIRNKYHEALEQYYISNCIQKKAQLFIVICLLFCFFLFFLNNYT